MGLSNESVMFSMQFYRYKSHLILQMAGLRKNNEIHASTEVVAKRRIDLLCSARCCLHAAFLPLTTFHGRTGLNMKAYANSQHVLTFAEISPSLFLF